MTEFRFKFGFHVTSAKNMIDLILHFNYLPSHYTHLIENRGL